MPDHDVANCTNVDVDFVVDNLCDAILDVIDHDDHGSCLLQLYLVGVDVVGIGIFLSKMLSNGCVVYYSCGCSRCFHEVVRTLLVQLLDVEVLVVLLVLP